MGEEIRGSCPCRVSFRVHDHSNRPCTAPVTLQEAEARYRKSKSELEELEISMQDL